MGFFAYCTLYFVNITYETFPYCYLQIDLEKPTYIAKKTLVKLPLTELDEIATVNVREDHCKFDDQNNP